MDQRFMAATMLMAGTGLFGVVAWIQGDRSALTTAPPEPESVRMDIAPLRPADDVELEEEEPVLELPPAEITGRRRRPAPAMPAPTPSEPVLKAPCSPWREIGPAHVDDGVPSGTRRVRELC